MPRIPQSPTCVTSGNHRNSVISKRNTLVEAHVHLVPPIAAAIAQTLPPSFELDDLIQSGHLGLLGAATRYRPRLHGGTPFSAYARPRIRGAILDSVKGGRYLANTMVSLTVVTDHEAPALTPAIHSVVEISIDASRRRANVEAVRAQLPLRLQAVLRARYGIHERSNIEMARTLRFTPESVSRIHAKALKAMKQGMQRRMLLNPAA